MESQDNVIVLKPGESMHDHKSKKPVEKAVVKPDVKPVVKPAEQPAKKKQ